MLYQRSLDIERRLEAVLGLIRKGSYSTPKIAEELGVSIPTVSRDVTALRQRGHDIRAERGKGGWQYLLQEKQPKLREGHFRQRGASERIRGTVGS